MKLKKTKELFKSFIGIQANEERNETSMVLLGRILSKLNNEKKTINTLHEVEFKVFSQWGDDGIIQYLINKIEMPKTFVEFGIQTYHESNTRFLLINDNWKGIVIDGAKENIDSVKNQNIYWQFDLTAVEAFITKDNINDLISSNGLSGEIGILSVDIDGNDYWVLENISVVNPTIIITEYNSTFGGVRNISVPYNPTFVRTNAHYSNLYWGASFSAFCHLCNKKGYTLVGCNSNGNNAYFVRNDKLGTLPTPSITEAFIEGKFREGRDSNGNLTFLNTEQRASTIKGMDVIDVITNTKETL